MSCCGGGDGGADDIRELEAQRAGRIQEGMGSINQIFSGFDPAFYNRRKQDYVNFAMPQLGDEARMTQNRLIYGLADRGLLGSNVAGQQQQAFQNEVSKQQQGIVDAAFGQAQNLQRDVEGQKSSLISQLQASADPNSVSQQAIASASGFSAPSAFQPISGLFSNFANLYLANQIANAYKQPAPQGGTGASGFAPVGNSVKRYN